MLAYPTLPSLEVLTDYRPKIPLRIYSAEGTLLGEFGEERRALVQISDVPDVMKQAILAAEDDRFYEHGGVDYMGVLRAAISNFHFRHRKAGSQHDHHASGAQFFSFQGKNLDTQSSTRCCSPSRSNTA